MYQQYQHVYPGICSFCQHVYSPFSKHLQVQHQVQISPLTLYYMQMSAVRVCHVGGVQPE